MKAIYLFVFLLCLTENTQLPAQILNPKKLLEKKAADKTNKILNKKADEAIDSLMGPDGKPKPKEEKPGKEAKGKTDTVANAKSSVNTPSLETYSKFDFVAGEKIIFFDDFSKDNIGNFPVLWNTNGSAEVVSTNLFPGR